MAEDPSTTVASLPALRMTNAPVLVVCGHYGVGKTNLSLNLALDAAARGLEATIVDLDVVNPFFRSSDYAGLLDEAGVRVIAPVFAGTNLDGPSLSGTILPAIEQARTHEGRLLVIDAGGDDVGATALGRFAHAVAAGPYEMLYVVNRSRNLTQEPAEAAEVLREIEAKSHLSATAVANNTHLQECTDEAVVAAGIPFAEEVARLAGLPLAFTTVPAGATGQVADRKITHLAPNGGSQALYPVQVYVRTPWQ
ncbi:ParA family protein [Gordonibacter sp. 28C]|uniref:ParA family protein n=1 Tax=Gordonibacter sp. 28C TaxID=2078569 RepID=UPI001F53E660|nr:ParA family protein [Gordonibacter sp. 28C]